MTVRSLLCWKCIRIQPHKRSPSWKRFMEVIVLTSSPYLNAMQSQYHLFPHLYETLLESATESLFFKCLACNSALTTLYTIHNHPQTFSFWVTNYILLNLPSAVDSWATRSVKKFPFFIDYEVSPPYLQKIATYPAQSPSISFHDFIFYFSKFKINVRLDLTTYDFLWRWNIKIVYAFLISHCVLYVRPISLT